MGRRETEEGCWRKVSGKKTGEGISVGLGKEQFFLQRTKAEREDKK